MCKGELFGAVSTPNLSVAAQRHHGGNAAAIVRANYSHLAEWRVAA